ncbi:MAG: AI-2E family transporter [Bryobacteraceae bacterium]
MPSPNSPERGKKSRSLASNLVALSASIGLLYYGRDFIVTLITAITISFLLEPFVALLMRLRLPRPVSAFIVCTLALMLLYSFCIGVYTQAAGLFEDLPAYSARISEISEQVIVTLESAEQSASSIFAPRRIREQKPPDPTPQPDPGRRRRSAEPPTPPPPPTVQEVRIRPDRSPLVDYFYTNWEQIAHLALLASFIPFLVYFMLSWGDQLRRNYLHLFHGTGRHAAGRAWQGIADVARAYVVGNFLLGLLLTIASGVFFFLIKLPYFLLVAPLSGFFSLVPYVGLPLAMIPPMFAGLPVFSKMPAYLIIAAVVGFLHLLALNLLYPKLVGSRVHLNPLAVTVALMFWGTLWGPVGLVYAIPITAAIKSVFDNVVEWQAYGKFLGD